MLLDPPLFYELLEGFGCQFWTDSTVCDSQQEVKEGICSLVLTEELNAKAKQHRLLCGESPDQGQSSLNHEILPHIDARINAHVILRLKKKVT